MKYVIEITVEPAELEDTATFSPEATQRVTDALASMPGVTGIEVTSVNTTD